MKFEKAAKAHIPSNIERITKGSMHIKTGSLVQNILKITLADRVYKNQNTKKIKNKKKI